MIIHLYHRNENDEMPKAKHAKYNKVLKERTKLFNSDSWNWEMKEICLVIGKILNNMWTSDTKYIVQVITWEDFILKQMCFQLPVYNTKNLTTFMALKYKVTWSLRSRSNLEIV